MACSTYSKRRVRCRGKCFERVLVRAVRTVSVGRKQWRGFENFACCGSLKLVSEMLYGCGGTVVWRVSVRLR